MSRVLASTAIATALIATAPAAAQVGVRASTSAHEPSQESVVVQGQRRQIAQALKKLIEQTKREREEAKV